MPAPTRPDFNFNSKFLFDAIIVGAGPAGLSAALSLCRMRRTAVVFSTDKFRNDKAHRAHTILSRDHQRASDIRGESKEQIDKYGTTHFVDRGVVKARKDDAANVFEVEDESGEKWRARKVVLAMGCKDVMPADIEGYEDCWGESIYQCLFCDGIERSDRPAGLLGFESAMSLHFVLFMYSFGVKDLTIFSNGPLKPTDDATKEALEIAKAKGAKVDERKIKKFTHLDNDLGIEILFDKGQSARIGFLSHTPPTEVVAPKLARDLGVEILSDGRGGTVLKRNEPMGSTNIPGVFAAGDAGIVLKQFTLAMGQGMTAGGGVMFDLNQEEERRIADKLRSQ